MTTPIVRVVARVARTRRDSSMHGLGPERVAHLGAVDRDLRDPGAGWIPFLAGRELVADVLVLGRRLPGDCAAHAAETTVSSMDHWLEPQLARPERVALERAGERLTYSELLAHARAAASSAPGRGRRPGERVPLAGGEDLRRRASRLPAARRRRGTDRPRV